MKAYTDEQVKLIEDALHFLSALARITPYESPMLNNALSTIRSGQDMEFVGHLSRWPEHPPTFNESYGNAEKVYAIKPKD